MARPKAGYYLDGKRVPGTTTIIGRFKESGGLIHWAWQCGVDGINYREARDSAATAGTLAHDMIENLIHGRPLEDVKGPEELLALARKGVEAFVEWKEQSRIEIVATEMSLVSKEYRFGGTPDAIGKTPAGHVLLDWKTSNRVYPDMLIQLAAYRHLWEAEHPDMPLGRFHLLRFGKEFGDFHHHSWPEEVIDTAWGAFVRMRDLYEIDKTLKRATG